MKKLLLHACCGPCASFPILELQKKFEVIVFYYNPNIHPEDEYNRRRDALKNFCLKNNLAFIESKYDPKIYFEKIKGNENNKKLRCPICYSIRLEEAAKKAKELKCTHFTTTLLTSPRQDIDLIKKIGEDLGNILYLTFLSTTEKDPKKKFKGLRSWFTESRKIARAENMYRQNYCGCIFSQKEI